MAGCQYSQVIDRQFRQVLSDSSPLFTANAISPVNDLWNRNEPQREELIVQKTCSGAPGSGLINQPNLVSDGNDASSRINAHVIVLNSSTSSAARLGVIVTTWIHNGIILLIVSNSVENFNNNLSFITYDRKGVQTLNWNGALGGRRTVIGRSWPKSRNENSDLIRVSTAVQSREMCYMDRLAHVSRWPVSRT